MGQTSSDSCFSSRTSSQSLPVYNDSKGYDIVDERPNMWNGWRAGREQARGRQPLSTLDEKRTAEGRNEYSAYAYYSSTQFGNTV